ncbi:uncharacterized protein LOC131882158 [Tigriopus californicus]|uniref:uncharacterized protein LOC131882158 n=1 Tax=Tigriopus californicus TaxID=6832 RepID=UPI0027DA1254|nr:uncharacterized protein LOC131882158 [Tigriopus californicus]
MKTFIATLGLVALAAADNAPRYEPRYQPSYKPSYEPSYKQPSYKEEPASYQYNYEVKDEYAGLNFDANEAREGYNTNGGYNVLLPDGRTQRSPTLLMGMAVMWLMSNTRESQVRVLQTQV